jgi:protein O-GlcNAc transferase
MASKFPFFPRTPTQGITFNIDQAFQQALALHRGGQIQNAAQLYEQILRRKPDHAGSLHMLGVVELSGGAFAKAKQRLNNAVRLLPQDAGVRVNLALALAECGEHAEALQRIDEALAINPTMAAARVNRLAILVKAGHYEAALQDSDALVSEGINHTEVQINRGIALLELQRPQEAVSCFEEVLKTAPQSAKASNNLAKALIGLKQFEAAMAQADCALSLQPHYPDAWSTKARALLGQGLVSNAEQVLRKALEAHPSTPALLLDHANCLIDLRRLNEAIQQVERALAAEPRNALGYAVGGRALAALGRHEDAIANFDKALNIDPDLRAALFAKAASEIDLKRFRQAIIHLKQCDTDPSIIVPVQMQICDWQDFRRTREQLHDTAIKDQRNPFPFLAMLDNPESHLKIAQAHLEYLRLQQAKQIDFPARLPGKIRVGYFSADYFNHATTHLMAELFESHDREHLEVHAFSLGPQRYDAAREKVAQSVHGFHDISGMTDQEAAALSRSLNIDIAIDLKGFTMDGRPGLFTERCAPIQVSYLGYPGTTGADYMDYVIADPIVIPPDQQRFFTEKPVYMPHSYQVNDSKRVISARNFARHELGLPDEGFVFCCFNNNYKILPDTFESWMRILQAVPKSVLWLFEGNDAVADNLRREAGNFGVHSDRLIFASRLPIDEHLARHSAADLFIDTLPYNAHTTASDALWAGLPILTLAGQSFAARVTASLLSAMNLSELITHTSQDYEAAAIRLATHPTELAALRARLQVQRKQSPLFDGKRFTRDLETAYRMMIERRQSGLPSEAIVVPPSSPTPA